MAIESKSLLPDYCVPEALENILSIRIGHPMMVVFVVQSSEIVIWRWCLLLPLLREAPELRTTHRAYKQTVRVNDDLSEKALSYVGKEQMSFERRYPSTSSRYHEQVGAKREIYGIGDGAGANGDDWLGDSELKSMTAGLEGGWFTFTPLKFRYS